MVDELVQWAQIFQGIGIIIGVIFGIVQLHQQNELAKSSNVQSLAAQAAEFNSKLIESDDALEAWYSFGKFGEAGSLQEKRYQELLTQWLILHENIFVQNQKGLLDKSIYDSWNRDLAYTVQKHNLSLLTSSVEEVFPGEFGKHIRDLQKLSKDKITTKNNKI